LIAPLPFTGERFTPEIKGAIWHEHWHRYSVMLPAARGLRVLDAACGEGYGSWLLASAATEVIGIDVDAAAVGHAAARYSARPNLEYMQASCVALPLAKGSVDLIVSFETIEHLYDQEVMLAEFRRVLAPTGVLVISSPNKAVYSGETGGANEFHVRELTRDELAGMLQPHFPQQAWYGQRVLAHSLLWKESADGARSTELVALADDRVREPAVPAPPMYFVVVCGAADVTLPELAGMSVFDDGAQSLYRDYERALLAEKRLYLNEIELRRIVEARLADLAATAKDLANARRVGIELEAELARARAGLNQLASAHDETRNRLVFRESWQGWLRWPLASARKRFGKRTP
jgi:2-polyprenyl-3-methyl-5-hydroxy-6-metoxy-1,4-benzoquinol methylase